jgi:hypothetical protein
MISDDLTASGCHLPGQRLKPEIQYRSASGWPSGAEGPPARVQGTLFAPTVAPKNLDVLAISLDLPRYPELMSNVA